MKKLYYIEIAELVDRNNNPIPAKKLDWYTPVSRMIAWENSDECMIERILLQRKLTRYIVAIRPAGFFKNLKIRCSKKWLVIPDTIKLI